MDPIEKAEAAIATVLAANPLHAEPDHRQAVEQVVMYDTGVTLVPCSCGVTLATRVGEG